MFPGRPGFDPVAAPGRLLRQSPENNRASVRTSRIGLAHEDGNFCRPPICGLQQARMRVEQTNFKPGQAFSSLQRVLLSQELGNPVASTFFSVIHGR